jgi:hypothetical protein
MDRSGPIGIVAAIAVAVAACAGGGTPSPSASGAMATPSTGASAAASTATPSVSSAAPAPSVPLPSAAPASPLSSTAAASPPTVGPATIDAAVGASTVACGTAVRARPVVTPAEPVPLAAVRAGEHAGFDRIVFELDGSVVPAFDVTPAEPPFTADASGLPIDVQGTSFLRIHFPFATGMGSYVGPAALPGPGGPDGTLAAVVLAGDYEGVLTWIAGARSPVCYRVSILGAPTRVVIDLQPVDGG